MSTADHRASTATKHTPKHEPHGHRIGCERACIAHEGTDRTRHEQKVRKHARILTGDELDFVFRL